MWYTWTTKQFLPIGEKLGAKGISAARAESISAARFLPGGQKRANTEFIMYLYTNWGVFRQALRHVKHGWQLSCSDKCLQFFQTGDWCVVLYWSTISSEVFSIIAMHRYNKWPILADIICYPSSPIIKKLQRSPISVTKMGPRIQSKFVDLLPVIINTTPSWKQTWLGIMHACRTVDWINAFLLFKFPFLIY